MILKQLDMIMKKYAVAFGIFTGLGILAVVVVLIISIPEEAGLFMTIIGLACSSVSMFLIAKDLKGRTKDRAKETYRI